MKIKNFSTVADADQFSSLLAAKNIHSIVLGYVPEPPEESHEEDDYYEYYDDSDYSKIIVWYPFDVDLSNPRGAVERLFPIMETVTGEKILSIDEMDSDENYIWCRLEGESSIFDFMLIENYNRTNPLAARVFLTRDGDL